MRVLSKLVIAGIAVFFGVLWSSPRFDAESLKGARVLITGASTGIGEQMAYHYSRMGAQVVITARRENVLRQVVEKCQSLGAEKALYVVGDMASPSDPASVVSFAVDQLGGLDYLVLNHIGPSPFTMWDGDMEHIQWLMQVNFYSYLQMVSKGLPTLEQSKGSIVVVSSMLGKMCSPFVAPYTSTKFALNGFFGTLQHELAMQGSNVSVSIVILGLIDTASAMEKVKGITNIPAYPASEAALHIIKAGATRQSESFYPWFIYYGTLFRDWFTFFRDLTIRYSYNYHP